MIIDTEKLIDYLIDLDKPPKQNDKKNKEKYSSNDQLSVQIGIERKNRLIELANKEGKNLSKFTRQIIDEFLFNHYEDEQKLDLCNNMACPLLKQGMKC